MYRTEIIIGGVSHIANTLVSLENVLSMAASLNAIGGNWEILDADTGEILAHPGWVSCALRPEKWA